MIKHLTILFIIIPLFVSCFWSEENSREKVSRVEIFSRLVEVGDEYFAQVQRDADSLKLAVQWFHVSGSPEDLDDVRMKWQAFVRSWHKTAILRFKEIKALEPQIEYWAIALKTRGVLTQRNLDTGAVYDSTFMASVVPGSKGIHALERLLYDSIHVDFLDSINRRNKDFLKALGEDVVVQVRRINNIWSSISPQILTPSSNNDSLYETGFEIMSQLVNQMAHHIEFLYKTKIGKPYIGNGKNPYTENMEYPFARFSLEALKANIEGFKDIYNGDSLALSAYVNSVDSELNQIIIGQINTYETTLNSYGQSFRTILEGDFQRIAPLYDISEKLMLSIKVDLANVLGVTIDFSDNDGD